MKTLSVMEKDFNVQDSPGTQAEQALFKVCGKVTEEEYVRFNHYMVFRKPEKRRKRIVFLIIMSVWVAASVAASVYSFVIGDYDDWPALLFVLAAFLYFLVYPRRVDRRAAKSFRNNKVVDGLEFEMSLYEDHFEDVSAIGSDSISYDKLHSIIDTPTNVYLMLGPNQGVILRKVDLPEGALEFLLQVKARLENSGENK